MKTEFISVEIVIDTDIDSPEWIAWFEEQDNCVIKNPGSDSKWQIFFAPIPSEDADSTIRNLCVEIDQLPEKIKEQWTKAVRREFFIGYDAGSEWPGLNDLLSLSTLQLVVDQKAEIRLAVYPTSSV